MTNKNKVKGSRWEHDLVELLTEKVRGSRWKRIAGSGALGTSLGEPLLTGDVSGKVDYFPKSFRVECKTGYNNSNDKEVKQLTIKKEWLDKITKEAEGTFSFPMLAGKFTNSRNGVGKFIVLNLDDFALLINMYTELKKDYEKLLGDVEAERGNPS